MKFKEGDKVRFVRNRRGVGNNRNYLLGKVFTIAEKYDWSSDTWLVNENTNFFFTEEELELVEKNEKIRIVIDPTDSAGAHRAVDKAIAEYRKKYFDWTDEELKQARELFKELAAEWVLDNHQNLVFAVNPYNKSVRLLNTSFRLELECAIAHNNDVFNPLIGKVVCLCKALDKPIPDFINNKNR